MKFWDASAVLPLLVAESTSQVMMDLSAADNDMIVWWTTEVECVSAIARLGREGALSDDDLTAIMARLDDLRSSWFEVQPVSGIRAVARRLLRTHILRAADALQLAAAIAAAEHNPASLAMVCLDERLCAAARREGFTVIPA